MKNFQWFIPVCFVAVFLVLSSLSCGWSASTISCHCFRDRSFDPDRPAAVDPYLLANAQNSLLAAVFEISKKEIVKKKMAGADGDQLWLTYAFARGAGMSLDEVAEARNGDASWRSLMRQNQAADRFPAKMAAVFRKGGEDVENAAAVVDLVLTTEMQIPPSAVAELRSSGADNQTAILAAVLGRMGNQPPVELFSMVNSRKVTWGQLADRFGVVPNTLEDRIQELINPLRPD